TANFWSTIGAIILGLGVLMFVIDLVRAALKGTPAGRDPWDARTLEWATHNPPKEYNFAYVPLVHARDQVWENKYGRSELKMDIDPPDHHGIHMPDQSWWPFFTSLGLFIFGLGMILHGQPWERIFAMVFLEIDTDAHVS